jgi:hypothetical protein
VGGEGAAMAWAGLVGRDGRIYIRDMGTRPGRLLFTAMSTWLSGVADPGGWPSLVALLSSPTREGRIVLAATADSSYKAQTGSTHLHL